MSAHRIRVRKPDTLPVPAATIISRADHDVGDCSVGSFGVARRLPLF